MGGEFRSFEPFLRDVGIEFFHYCPHTSQQNGIVERKHRHIVEMGLSMLAQSSMPRRFWFEAFSLVVFLINRLPTPILGNISLWEKAFHQIPDFKSLRTFRCSCFPCLRPYQSHKFQYHSTKCVFIGYSFSHKGYKCLSSSGRIYVTRHVVFNENEFPFQSVSSVSSTDTIVHFVPFPSQSSSSTSLSHNPLHVSPSSPTSSPLAACDDHPSESQGASPNLESSPPDLNISSAGPAASIPAASPDLVSQQLPDVSAIPDLNSNESAPVQQPHSLGFHPMQTRAKSGIFRPKIHDSYLASSSVDLTISEPLSVKDVLQSSLWKQAMDSEMAPLKRN